MDYLTATIKVPVRINEEGELIVLDNCAEISIEPLTSEPRDTFDSIYEKTIEYMQQNMGLSEEPQSIDPQSIDPQSIEHVKHTFPYFKKSKKPLNASFRNKGTKHNFTKKNYE